MIGKFAAAVAAALLVGTAGLGVNVAAARQWRGGGGGGFGAPSMHFGGGAFRGPSMGFASPRFFGRGFASPHFATRRFASPFGHANRFARRPTFNAARVAHRPAGLNGSGGRPGTNVAGRNTSVAFAQNREAPAFRHGQFGWRRFHRGFVGWAGPVFWPYAFDDLFDYAFWPYDEYGPDDDIFWAYGYDDLFAGILLPYDYADYYGGYGAAQPAAAQSGALPASSVAQLCGTAQPISSAIPIDRIVNAVQPIADQRVKLDALKAAEAEAQKALAASCATQMPATAIGRLDAVQTRLDDMIKGVGIVSKPLDDFYASLSDEQKARFNALGESRQAMQQGAAGPASLAQLCGPQNAIPVVSVGQIDQAVKPDAQQGADLIALRDAANKADATILATCPAQPPLTPPGRLDAIRSRLQAMLRGVETVRPALQSFYASLNDAQKSRFDAASGRITSGAPSAKPRV